MHQTQGQRNVNLRNATPDRQLLRKSLYAMQAVKPVEENPAFLEQVRLPGGGVAIRWKQEHLHVEVAYHKASKTLVTKFFHLYPRQVYGILDQMC